jgi:hypothetical protein
MNLQLKRGVPQEGARIFTSSKIVYHRVPQKLWPTARIDGKLGQQFHLTQILFDAEFDAGTGYAKTYLILLQFEKTIKEYTSKEVAELTSAQFQKMNMNLGDILEPITSLCSTKGGKPWNGMIKVYLQHPETNGHALLSGLRIFSLIIDGETKIPKVAKSYNSLVPNDLLTVTISSPNLSYLPLYEILTDFVKMGFHKEQDDEIT